MTVIFSKRNDTLFLQKIWEGLQYIKVIEIEAPDDYPLVETAMESECLLICGHGTPSGLIAPALDSVIVGDHNVELLRGKTLIGIW